MAAYDCGDKDCDECKRAFGPDRSKAIANYEARERFYAQLPQAAGQLPSTHSAGQRES